MTVWMGVAFVVAYAAGMFPTAVLVGHKIGHDPTSEGSGNPGATNIYRLGGRLAGVAVALGDMAKGAAPVGAALLLWDRPEAMAAWTGAVAGHVWPAIRRFRGGKGMATAGGGGIVLDPIIGAICVVVFFGMVRLTRVAALGSLSVGVSYPVLALVLGWPGPEVVVAAVVMGVMAMRHHGNIVRLLRGTERRLTS
ncbi:MAG: glycerol-3-phosphate acyltransferase [Acidimicrobiaceae bacterium]|nr:glycerol-3-phosphate acyltransferase [Acidimicrobiaceae bacterium]MYA00103.1 glycerol-3-phosphate acyltransferase [Acidimicrobiaceae bacterium]MYE97676.1 glycerol-3-phosphate acyltransferase [Acidimicrobiaceae bacterium]MYH43980.1 glycerol-3-phosphate acyltransferase [Acidimicrobiaceae bacterium]MYI54790.1 glycerol-3-phosphate acyltransferase [Acidimicrobiaceae bacterium]